MNLTRAATCLLMICCSIRIANAQQRPSTSDVTTQSSASTNKNFSTDPLAPSIISMHFADAPMLDVLGDFARQSQADLGIGEPRIIDYCKDKRVSLDLDGASFWEAIRIIGSKTGLWPDVSQNGPMQLVPESPTKGEFEGIGQDVGLFRVTPFSCTEGVGHNYENGISGLINFEMRLIPEPKVAVLGPADQKWLASCSDDRGHALDFYNVALWSSMAMPSWWRSSITVREVQGMGDKFGQLQGQAQFIVQEKSREIDIDDISKIAGTSETFNGLTIRFQSLKHENGQWTLTMNGNGKLANTPSASFDVLGTRIWLVDEEGRSYGASYVQTMGRPVSQRVVQFYSINQGRYVEINPKKLRWEFPTAIRVISVPIDYRNLDLPPTVKMSVETADNPSTIGPASRIDSSPNTNFSPKEFDELVGQLDSDIFEVRNEAQDKLIAMGEDAEPKLRQILKSSDSPEVQARIQAILNRLDEESATNATFVTLHYDNAPLFDVLKDFANQAHADLGTHYRYFIDYCQGKRISLDLDRVSFWDALRVIGKKAAFWPSVFGNQPMRLEVRNPPDWLLGPSVSNGPFLFAVVSTSIGGSISYTGETISQPPAASLDIVAIAEPKLRTFGKPEPDPLSVCLDDNGQSLLPPHPQGFSFTNILWYFPLNESLVLPPVVGSRISRIEGKFRCNVGIKSQSLDITDLSKLGTVSQQVAGVTVTLKSLVRAGNSWNLDAMSTGELGSDPWRHVTELTSDMLLVDAHDEAFEFMQNGMPYSGGPAGTTITFLKTEVPGGTTAIATDPPVRLIWKVPTQIRQLVIPFQILNIELPHRP